MSELQNVTTLPIPPVFFWAIVLAALCAIIAAWLPQAGLPKPPALQRLQKWLGRKSYPTWAMLGSVVIAFIAAVLWLSVLGLLLYGLTYLIIDVIAQTPPQRTNATAVWEWRFHLAQIAALTTVTAAVIALPITVNRLRQTRLQTQTAIESLFNEKITAAAADLHTRRQITVTDANGARHDEWQDDIIRRNAAIDRLHGLVEERPEIAQRVANLLCVYVRELSREYPPVAPPDTQGHMELRRWAYGLSPIRSDMENAVKVLGGLTTTARLDTNTLYFDLRRTNLQGFDLSGLDLRRAMLDDAALQGASLARAKLQEATLFDTRLQGTYLMGTELQGANLRWAKLQGAITHSASLQRAEFIETQLQGASFASANMQGAFLRSVGLDASKNLSDASLRGAALRDVDLTNAPQIAKHLNDVFADGSVTLPANLNPETDWPAHWPKERLGIDDFDTAWRKWQQTLTPPLPPEALP